MYVGKVSILGSKLRYLTLPYLGIYIGIYLAALLANGVDSLTSSVTLGSSRVRLRRYFKVGYLGMYACMDIDNSTNIGQIFTFGTVTVGRRLTPSRNWMP